MWLDAPRAQIFCAQGCPERSAFSHAPEVFREGPENGAPGACAPRLRVVSVDFFIP